LRNNTMSHPEWRGCPNSSLWYMFDPATSGCAAPREELRSIMYGYGFSYAFLLPFQRAALPDDEVTR